MALAGWHRGERAMHAKLNYTRANESSFQWIDDHLPSEHRTFYKHNLPFLPVAVVDDHGRVWSVFAFQKSGERGFLRSPSSGALEMELDVFEDDPLYSVLERKRQDQPVGEGNFLAAGIGIDLTNRRRNKIAGVIDKVKRSNQSFLVKLKVTQALGNCPKYISIRDLVPHREYKPRLLSRQLFMSSLDKLPPNVIKLIESADTVFLGTYYKAPSEDSATYPSHVGINHRGGRPGFIRVRQDGRSIVLPDYSGNRLMTSLGSILVTPVASLALADFVSGTVVYVTGKATNLLGDQAKAIQPRSSLITVIEVTGYMAIADALSVRQKPGSKVTPSPYSPPIRYLAEEPQHPEKAIDATDLTLSSVEILSSTLAKFVFDCSRPVNIIPGQYAVLDCSTFVGKNGYRHMAFAGQEATLNDDGIRTWTISSAHRGPTKRFTITMREKPNGVATGRLFQVALKLQEKRPDLLLNTTPLGLTMPLVGIGGSFVAAEKCTRFLMLAGGIGITPFISMLAAFARQESQPRDVILAVSSREPGVSLRLLEDAFEGKGIPGHIAWRLVIFTKAIPRAELPLGAEVRAGRMDASFFESVGDIHEREVMCCGPGEWESAVFGGLDGAGVTADRIRKEGFAF